MASFADRLRTLLRGDRAPAGPRRPLAREQGRPPSANGASSMHAHWVGVPDGVMSCSVDLTVLTRPTSDDLHFWGGKFVKS